MSSRRVEVLQGQGEADHGAVVIRLRDVADLSAEAAAVTIKPIDDEGGAADGWPVGAIAPRSIRPVEGGFELVIDQAALELPALQPGTPVSIELPAIGLRAETRWPALALARTDKRRAVVMTGEQLAAEVAARVEAERKAAAAAEAQRLAAEREKAAAEEALRIEAERQAAEEAQRLAALAEQAALEKAERETAEREKAARAKAERETAEQQRREAAARRLAAEQAAQAANAPPAGTTSAAHSTVNPAASLPASTAADDGLLELDRRQGKAAPVAAARSSGDTWNETKPSAGGAAALAAAAAAAATAMVKPAESKPAGIGTAPLEPGKPMAAGRSANRPPVPQIRRELVAGVPDHPQSSPSGGGFGRAIMPFVLGCLVTGAAFATYVTTRPKLPALPGASAPAAVQIATAPLAPPASPTAELGPILDLPRHSPLGVPAEKSDVEEALRRADASLGSGSEEQRREAKFWLRKAVALGLGDERLAWAFTQLGTLYAVPTAGAPDYASAKLLWELAAATGDPIAGCFLAALHEHGLATPRSGRRALELYERSRSRGGCPGGEEAIARLKGG